QNEAATAIVNAVSTALDQGIMTADIAIKGNTTVNTKKMGDAIAAAL
ncbi:MAG: isocitrate/isopropylmalate family dehydrogenase, partial [Thermodesulfobacteriota bacterium]|nr:isocitrate/isopropylmalate family dehydrogenase [Thermodesulfobacteriota bacterium]